MSLLSLEVGRCVRTTNKFSICNACVESCPVETIKIDEHIPAFVPNDCVGCGGCVAACPDAAFSLDDLSVTNFIFSFLESEKEILSCKDELPCLAALSTEELLSLVLLDSRQLSMERAHCAECSIAHLNEKIIERRVEEVNFLLEAMEVNKSIVFDVLEKPLVVKEESIDRRDFLSKVSLKEAAKAKQSFENRIEAVDEELKRHLVGTEDIQSIRDKKIPERRKLLFLAMKRAGLPSQFHTIDTKDIDFISQKRVDMETCTNCQMCYRICPTGALSSDDKGSFIAFDAFNCIKCHSCHDVCEPDALTLSPLFEIRQLFEPSQKKLVEFDVRRCDECGMPFVYRGGEKMCQRCRIEEEEARSLWGIE